MTNINQMPDLAKAMQGLKISVELESIKKNTLLGIAIEIGLREKRLPEAISLIKKCADEDYMETAWVVGNDLLKTIVDY